MAHRRLGHLFAFERRPDLVQVEGLADDGLRVLDGLECPDSDVLSCAWPDASQVELPSAALSQRPCPVNDVVRPTAAAGAGAACGT